MKAHSYTLVKMPKVMQIESSTLDIMESSIPTVQAEQSAGQKQRSMHRDLRNI